MRLVVNTNVIVGECLRESGRALLTHPALTLYQPEYAAAETAYEVQRRLTIITERGVWTADEAEVIRERVARLLRYSIPPPFTRPMKPPPAAACRKTPTIGRWWRRLCLLKGQAF